jgi:hypothetical protein
MNMHQRWNDLDAGTRRRLHGHDGRGPFREAVHAIVWAFAHETLRARVAPAHHEALERVWYGSRLPAHPLHRVRAAVHASVADWLEDADDYAGSPLPQTFAWIDAYVLTLEHIIDALLEPRPSRAAGGTDQEMRIPEGAA